MKKRSIKASLREKDFDWKDFLKNSQSYIALVAIFIVASLVTIKNGKSDFLSLRNLMNMLRSISENGIIAIGMTLVILLGDIDLSVGSVVGLISAGSASLMVNNGFGYIPIILISLALGALFGLFNGLIVTRMRIPAFIATLATMNIIRGLARYWSNGISMPYGPGLVPAVPFCTFIVLVIIFSILMNRTRFGRQIYAIGDNATAAHLSGINVKRIKTIAFMLCAMLSSIAGIIHNAQIFQGGPNEGTGYELSALAAVAIGGTSMAGGKGTIFGTMVGALIIGMLDNLLGLKSISSSNLQLVIKGMLIIIAVFMQAPKKAD